MLQAQPCPWPSPCCLCVQGACPGPGAYQGIRGAQAALALLLLLPSPAPSGSGLRRRWAGLGLPRRRARTCCSACDTAAPALGLTAAFPVSAPV